MGRLWVLLMMGMVLGFGGCALPRAAILMTRVPVVEGGKSKLSDADVFLSMSSVPSVELEVESRRAPRPTMEWYRARLLKDGWALDTEGDGPWGWYGEVWSGRYYTARRDRYRVGNNLLVKEEVRILFDLGKVEGTTQVTVHVSGDYVWDHPTWAAFEYWFAWAFVSPGYTALLPLMVAMPLQILG